MTTEQKLIKKQKELIKLLDDALDCTVELGDAKLRQEIWELESSLEQESKTAREILEKYDIEFPSEEDREYYTNQILQAMHEFKEQSSNLKDELFKLPYIDIKTISRVLTTSLQSGDIEMIKVNIEQLITRMIDDQEKHKHRTK